MRPRRWLVITLLLALIVAATIGWRFWNRADVPQDGSATATANATWPAGTPMAATIANQLHFTFTLPSGWTLHSWSKAEIQASGQGLGAEVPRLRQSLERWLAAFQADSQVLLLQPDVAQPSTQSAVLFSIKRHGLRLEQIAATLAEQVPLRLLMDTSLRPDGQPILRIRGEQLSGLDSFATRPAEVAIMAHPDGALFLVIILLGEGDSNPNLADTLLRDLHFE